MILQLLISLISVSAYAAQQTEVFANFTQYNHGGGNGNITAIHQSRIDTGIIGVYNYVEDNYARLMKFSATGENPTAIATTTGYHYDAQNYGASQVYWDTKNFVVPLYSNGQNNNFGILQRYDYNLNLDTNFGTAGTASVGINDTPIIFSTVTKYQNYYYAGGFIYVGNNEGSPIIVRLNSSGKLDTTFNNTGYMILNLVGNDYPRVSQILFLQNRVIIKIINQTNTILKSFALDFTDEKSASLNTIDTSNIEMYNNTSFVIGNISTINKYSDQIIFDTTLNGGNLLQPFGNNQIITLKKINNFLLVGGEVSAGNNMFKPILTCYNITDCQNPALETTFFDEGAYTPSTPVTKHGIQNLIITCSTVHSLFFAGGEYITHVDLSTDFTKKLLLSNIRTAQEKISSIRCLLTSGTRIPFIDTLH